MDFSFAFFRFQMCMQFDRFYFVFVEHTDLGCLLNTLAEKALFHPHEIIIVHLQPKIELERMKGKRRGEYHVVVRNDSVSRVTLEGDWHQSLSVFILVPLIQYFRLFITNWCLRLNTTWSNDFESIAIIIVVDFVFAFAYFNFFLSTFYCSSRIDLKS